ncbi:MAG: protease SohB [Proteobacteria bacterium]|nr:protease SohB [Pseudomonadota bacterium]
MQNFSDWVQFAVSAAVVILFLLILLSLLILILKRGKKGEKTAFAVEHLNASWTQNEDRIRSAVMTRRQFSELLKQRDKAEKEKEKDKKKSTPADETQASSKTKKVYVIDFEGDVSASECNTLRNIVSALVSVTNENDEVVVRLESPGGVVHGYGLAASQLARLKDRKIPLTVCVDKVAASGGYMMACVADKIVAAPFAFIGSIGVVSSTPNFNRLLKKHDIDFVEQTAGEHKRTLSLFGEINDSKKAKHQQDLEVIHGLFKKHVAQYRPKINIDAVATGEVWLGQPAKELGLVDEIRTSDDLLMELGKNADVYLVKSESEQNWKTKLMKQLFSLSAVIDSSLTGRMRV